MDKHLALFIYSILIIIGSMLGGSIPSFVRMTHIRMQSVLSLVGGFMLGVALLHMLPHGVVACANAAFLAGKPTGRSVDLVLGCTLIGLIFTFLMIRTLHFHQHGPTAHDSHEHGDEECDHHSHKHAISWTGVAFGLCVHTVMDGVAVGAAVFSDHGTLPGLAVFLAVLLHKPLDALSITTVMASGGIAAKKRQLINIGVAIMCPVGAYLVVALSYVTPTAGVSPINGNLLGVLLGLSAGAFLCISLSDLLPEVQFHSHDRVRLSAALLLGVAFAYGIGLLEHQHAHAWPGEVISESRDHDHDPHAGHQHGSDG